MTMTPRIPFHLNAEGYKRFGELLATVGMQFLEQRREAMPALHYPIDSFRLLLVCKRIWQRFPKVNSHRLERFNKSCSRRR
jgi:hypothetical protein